MRKKITMYAGAILFVLASITSCDKDEEIIPAVFSIDQTEKDFGTVEVEQSASYSFEVTNKGEADLEIDEFVIKGTDAADFSTSAVPKVIRKGEAYSFEITFAPLTEGNKEAILEITTNIGKKEVTVTGVAEPKPLPTVDLNVTTLSFGEVEINQTDDATFTITNSGDADLEITAFEVKGTNASEFATAATAETLAVGGTKTVSVTFAPTTEGNKTASLEITTNIGVKIITLDGKGTAVAEPVMTFSESPIAFGNVEVGQELSKNITISNTGNADLDITNVNIVGSSTASSFTVIGGTTALIKTIAPGDTHTFEVKFMPSSQGYVSASIRFLNNSNDSDVFLGMNGTGTAPAQPVMTFSESPIVFGNVEVGQELSKNITISNTGNADLEITNVNIVGGSTASSFTVIGGTTALIRTLAPGDTHTFGVKFTPSSEGYVSASIRFKKSDGTLVLLGMNGTGTAPAQPAIAFSETGLSFGDVTVGNSGNDLTFAIQNNGQGNLEVSNIRISGANASDFNLINVSAPQTIVSNGSYTVTVRFTPQSEGQKYAQVFVENNDPTKPNYGLIVQGKGLQATTGNVVSIPDANFKAALVGNSSINTNGDTEIQVSEAQAFTGEIRVDGLSISDVTGLEAFVNISQFHAMNNALTSIDLSQNTAITRLTLKGNNLTALDLSANTALQTVLIQQNDISSTIDLSNHSSLVNLDCGDNNISTLLLPTTANGLRTLYLGENQISTLDVSMYPDLRTLVVYKNNLTSVDISNNSKVRTLHVRDNNLTSLNVANGNNVNFFYMIADGNDDLTCIQHDAGFDPLNPPNTQANQWAKPSGASWSTVACQ